jgi:hypothetical protein
MEVGKKKTRILLYSWLSTGTCHKNLVSWEQFFKIWQIEQFFPWKILCIAQTHIFQVETWWKFTSKRNTGTLRSQYLAAWHWNMDWITHFLDLEYNRKARLDIGTSYWYNIRVNIYPIWPVKSSTLSVTLPGLWTSQTYHVCTFHPERLVCWNLQFWGLGECFGVG